ncbi:sigma-54-dependent Fis family transcriptional regulator [Desulfovibrio legallii]|uniref:Regulatory protein, Fis family n=1 Tax=Desulfovibrio legallii TaxID=571438 RepID=A0A1G7P4Y7_9BACT|nr:sigma-54-dependent Fis family transcriptional regulator [Desulfovibrio legallii]SDF81365.1 regulatory protein, Fis family [Desulfovibrio legallii]
MPYQVTPNGLSNPSLTVGQVLHHLSRLVTEKMDRNAFFRILAKQLRVLFHYDRFCINLYDAEREFLNLFTAADGTVVESLSNTRIASNTVAGLAIASRKPVVINDLASQDFGMAPLSLATVGLNATIALPLIINREVIGTLHVSFARQPENVVEILNFLLELSPVLTTFLFAVLAEERAANARAAQTPQLEAGESEADKSGLESRLLETPDMVRIMGTARKVAKLHIPVLITGETGTGKSMLARWLHRHSPRRAHSFVKVNCPSLAPTLFESEMFGYAKGAFTGATAKRTGRIEIAQHGTLFLDEIGDLVPEMQSKLLQVLEENSFERVGEATPIGVDIRVLSATNVNLAEAMTEGRLRRDLYYRLGSVVLHMPALRERKADIPMFVDHFLRQFATEYELRPPRLPRSAVQALYEHAWPGNIRELRNVVSRILLHSLDAAVTDAFVRETLHLWVAADGSAAQAVAESPAAPVRAAPQPAAAPPAALPTLEENERAHICRALALTGGKVSGSRGAAALLGVPRSTLQHRMRKLGITETP